MVGDKNMASDSKRQDILSEEFVGKEYSKEIALTIEREGYSYTVSCRDGTIARIVKPVYPKQW